MATQHQQRWLLQQAVLPLVILALSFLTPCSLADGSAGSSSSSSRRGGVVSFAVASDDSWSAWAVEGLGSSLKARVSPPEFALAGPVEVNVTATDKQHLPTKAEWIHANLSTVPGQLNLAVSTHSGDYPVAKLTFSALQFEVYGGSIKPSSHGVFVMAPAHAAVVASYINGTFSGSIVNKPDFNLPVAKERLGNVTGLVSVHGNEYRLRTRVRLSVLLSEIAKAAGVSPGQLGGSNRAVVVDLNEQSTAYIPWDLTH